MNSKIITFIIAIAAGVALIVGGGYIAIDNLFHPQGMLFEGVVLTSIGILLTLMVTVALSIGQTIIIFGQIMEQQVKIQNEMREMSKSAQRPGNISSILSNLIPGMTDENTSISITDLTDGKINNDNFPIDLEVVRKMMSKGKTPEGSKTSNELDEMKIEELEKELSKAIKKDDFERAGEINKAIKALKGDDPDYPKDLLG